MVQNRNSNESDIAQDTYSFVYSTVFSPQGKHYLFSAANKKDNFIVANGIKNRVDGELLATVYSSHFIFDSEDEFHYIINKEIDKRTTEITIIDATFAPSK